MLIVHLAFIVTMLEKLFGRYIERIKACFRLEYLKSKTSRF